MTNAKLTTDQREKVVELYERHGIDVECIQERFGISRETVFRILRQHRRQPDRCPECEAELNTQEGEDSPHYCPLCDGAISDTDDAVAAEVDGEVRIVCASCAYENDDMEAVG